MSGEVIDDEIDSFIEEVSALKLCWSVVGHNGAIRSSDGWCPIVEVCRARGIYTNEGWFTKMHGNYYWPLCARDLGLSAKAALAIVWAADGICTADYRELRLRLIKALEAEKEVENVSAHSND